MHLYSESPPYTHPSTSLPAMGVLIDELMREMGYVEGAHSESIKTTSALLKCLDKGSDDFTSFYTSPLVSVTQ